MSGSSNNPVAFQSTHPVRGATAPAAPAIPALWHFNPRTPCGVRPIPSSTKPTLLNFNPRTPCGVRPNEAAIRERMDLISIHAPRAGCDAGDSGCNRGGRISIHAPRAGCDYGRAMEVTGARNFNPRTPCGVRRSAPARSRAAPPYFNPRTPCGVRRTTRQPRLPGKKFQSTHPVRGATARTR